MNKEFAENNGCNPEDCSSCPGCGGFSEDFPRTISLTMDDDTVVECAVLTIYPVDEKFYIALVPLDEEGEIAANEVYIYGFRTTDEGNPVLSNIEDDDEYERASQAFDSIMEEAETVAASDPEE
ncbi:MAG: DUF1292 domain-containing protein [Blautia sp.]|nr:DUF1292 domain-containing protein [Blautia sp.]